MTKEELIASFRGRIGERVILAMNRVPRELFVPERLRSNAYDDTPLSIGYEQTISAPHMVAIMCDLLDLQKGMSVLEVGGGSGYHAAVMADLVGPEGHIFSIERHPELVATARKSLNQAGTNNVVMIEGDGSIGLPDRAPFDRISVAATAPKVPEPLKQQLKVGGKMVIPVGTVFQELVIVTRINGFAAEEKMGVAFVPLIGKEGFSD